MKIVVLIVRLLLGLVFLVFGLNAFLQFLEVLHLVSPGRFFRLYSIRSIRWRSSQCRRLATRCC